MVPGLELNCPTFVSFGSNHACLAYAYMHIQIERNALNFNAFLDLETSGNIYTFVTRVGETSSFVRFDVIWKQCEIILNI